MFLAASDVLYGVIGFAILGLIVTAAIVTLLKGKTGFFLGGIFLQLFWYIGAIRLAKPKSWWARRFYGPEKMGRAVTRHGAEAGAPPPRRERPTVPERPPPR